MRNTTSDQALQPDALKFISDYVGPINSLILVGALVLDIASPGLGKVSAKLLALTFAAMALLLVWVVVARLKRCPPDWPAVRRVVHVLLDRVVLLTGAALLIVGVFCVGSVAHAEGVVAATLPAARDFQQQVLGIGADVASIKAALAPTDARGQLEKLGYHLDNESKARAIESCDLKAAQLYIALQETLPVQVPVMGYPGPSVLEKPIIEQNAKLPEMLALLVAQGMNFDEPQEMAFVMSKPELVPDAQALRNKVPASKRAAFQVVGLQANPLTLAVWFRNKPAADALLKMGARDDVGVKINLFGSVPDIRPLASAAEEAKRLGFALR